MSLEEKLKDIRHEWIRIRTGRVILEYSLRSDLNADKKVLEKEISEAKNLEFCYEDIEMGLIREQKLERKRIERIRKEELTNFQIN